MSRFHLVAALTIATNWVSSCSLVAASTWWKSECFDASRCFCLGSSVHHALVTKPLCLSKSVQSVLSIPQWVYPILSILIVSFIFMMASYTNFATMVEAEMEWLGLCRMPFRRSCSMVILFLLPSRVTNASQVERLDLFLVFPSDWMLLVLDWCQSPCVLQVIESLSLFFPFNSHLHGRWPWLLLGCIK